MSERTRSPKGIPSEKEMRPQSGSVARRADALDALRGLAILLMILSGAIHYQVPLPAWMYHAQVPPPEFKFNPDLPGITWVDLVFPFFLFSMGAAFPFALSKKIAQGVPQWKIIGQILERGMLLAWFAIFIQHVKPYSLNPSPDTLQYLVGIFGFVLLFAMLLRLPDSVKPAIKIAVKCSGYATAVALLAVLTYPNGTGFMVSRSDIIIIVLANTAVFGSLIWLFTRENILLRLGILGILLALRLTQSIDGSWNHELWRWSPIPWVFTLYYLQYLFIVVPGMIAGDCIQKWMVSPSEEVEQPPPSAAMHGVFLVMIAIVVITVSGLFARAIIATVAADVLLCAAGLYLLPKNGTALEKHYRSLFQWGVYWLVLGLFFEAYEGGIKKDHPTLSYYFVMNGLAIASYLAFSILIDIYRKRGAVAMLISNGQNPMIAYVGASLVVLPIMALTSIDSLIGMIPLAPWVGLAKGTVITILVAFLTDYFTKKKLFWRT